jgi:hypothetical protein
MNKDLKLEEGSDEVPGNVQLKSLESNNTEMLKVQA